MKESSHRHLGKTKGELSLDFHNPAVRSVVDVDVVTLATETNIKCTRVTTKALYTYTYTDTRFFPFE